MAIDWQRILEIMGMIISASTILAAIYGAIQFIDWRIKQKIFDESFLKKISASIRPMVIFDENESILIDQGAMDVIKQINVSCLQSKDHLPEVIMIHPKRHLINAPILQTLENELVDIEISRGNGFCWKYKLDYQMYNEAFKGKRRFRLEVIL